MSERALYLQVKSKRRCGHIERKDQNSIAQLFSELVSFTHEPIPYEDSKHVFL